MILLYMAETHVLGNLCLLQNSRAESLTLSDLKKPQVLKLA